MMKVYTHCQPTPTRSVPPSVSSTESADPPLLSGGVELSVQESICPYYIRERSPGLLYCECARFRFPDKVFRREILYRFCAHPEGYQDCPIKIALDHYYERKYRTHEDR